MTTLEWLAQLIAFDTTSRNSNMELIQCAKSWFAKHGLVTRITTHPFEAKANLLATLPGKNGNLQGGILFSGHTDVVPVDGQHWETNPFEAVKKNGRVYGRGTCDMKGFLAVLLALVPEFCKLELNYPLHFAFSYDEEIGCRGAPLLIADMQKAGIQPAFCIVGEPSEMRTVIAHKGIQSFHCKIEGKAAHSSLTPKGCNAIDYAAELICHIRKLANDLKKQGPFDQYFDVPFTTISTNMINGGIAHNIIPADCEFFFEFRHLPTVKPENIIGEINHYIENDLLPRMQQEYQNAKISIDHLASVPAFEAKHEIISKDSEIYKVAYATEAGLFQQANIPTIVMGPGSIEQAHCANEFVELEQLRKCEQILQELVRNFEQ
jgi:acetylornithine deacetylase